MHKILKLLFILFLTFTTQLGPILGNLKLRAQSKDRFSTAAEICFQVFS